MRPILVVEDDPVLGRALADALRDDGYCVRTASNGHVAVAAVLEDPPGLIIMDVMMPIMNGVEALQRIRALPNGRTIAVVLMSALRDRLHLSADIVGFLVKPFDLDEFLAVVEHAIGPAST